MVAETQLFEAPYLTPLHFCLWGWMNSEVYKREEDARDELLARILDAAVRVKKREALRRQKKRTILAHEADSGISEHLLRIVTNLPLKKIKIKTQFTVISSSILPFTLVSHLKI
jgi:hypothetical protein